MKLPAGDMRPPSSTTTLAVAVMPSDEAVTTAVPVVCAVTKPLSTVATAGAELDQVVARVSGPPDDSFGVAVSCSVSSGTRSSALSDMVIVATAGGAMTSLQLASKVKIATALNAKEYLLRRIVR